MNYSFNFQAFYVLCHNQQDSIQIQVVDTSPTGALKAKIAYTIPSPSEEDLRLVEILVTSWNHSNKHHFNTRRKQQKGKSSATLYNAWISMTQACVDMAKERIEDDTRLR